MTIINNTFPPIIRSKAAQANDEKPVQPDSSHASPSAEVNAPLLKALVTRIAKPDGADKLEGIRATLNHYGLDTSAVDFDGGKLRAATEQLKTVNSLAQPSDDVAEMLASQSRRVNSTEGTLGDIEREIATDRTRANYSLSQFKVSVSKVTEMQGPPAQVGYKSQALTTHTSYAQLWAAMANAINHIKSEYVDFYADLMQKYTKMYEAYNTHVQTNAAEAVTAGNDANKVKFDQGKMQKGYDGFRDALAAIDLGSVKNWDKMTLDERLSMKITLEPAFKVDDGSGKISFNIDVYSAAPGSPAGMNNGQVSTPSYQSWLASFNAGGSALQSNMQAFAQRYSQANSTFDNLNKVLSGSITALADSARDVLKSL